MDNSCQPWTAVLENTSKKKTGWSNAEKANYLLMNAAWKLM